jgi:hypothetical protein
MKKIILCSVLATGLMVGTVDAAKAKKKESEVTKALKQAYPDAETKITATNEVNGVKVYDVTVKGKSGESTAQITDYGDFVMYGVPHEYAGVKNLIQSNVAGLFKSAPDDIEMYRVTNYYVEFPGAHGKNYSASFDALGQLKDIHSAAEIAHFTGGAHGQKASADEAKRAEQHLKKILPEAQVQGVYKAEQGGDFLYVATNNGELIVNPAGQVYSMREQIKPEELPEPVLVTIEKMFSAQPSKAYRGEYEYYQFNQQSQTGQPIVVKMRPNGDILEVRNDAAAQAEQAVQAKSKQKSTGHTTEKKG